MVQTDGKMVSPFSPSCGVLGVLNTLSPETRASFLVSQEGPEGTEVSLAVLAPNLPLP